MQRGSLKVIKDRRGVKIWRAQWREDGNARTRLLGRYLDVSRDEARAAFDAILAPLNARQIVSPSVNISLRRYVEDEYLPTKTRNWKASTRATTEQIIETHILAPLGSRSLRQLTRKELQAHLDSKAATKLSFSLVSHIRWQLVAIFRMALSDALISTDPAAGLVSPRCHGDVDKRVIGTSDMQRAQMVLEPRERLILRLAVCEGMRPGEITGLQIGDIQDGVVHIQRRIYRGVVDTPKSRRSRRMVPLTEGTVALLAEYMDMMTGHPADAWLFPSENITTPLNYNSVYRRRIQKALQGIGLGHVNFQILRRSWVTELGEVEKDSRVRASLAGHSVDVSENEYRQPPMDTLRRTMGKVDRRLQ